MTLYRIASLVVLIGLLQVLVAAQESLTPWRSDPLFQRFAAALDAVPAIDVHTHLLRPESSTPRSPRRDPCCFAALIHGCRPQGAF
jgi:hypothetical protein